MPQFESSFKMDFKLTITMSEKEARAFQRIINFNLPAGAEPAYLAGYMEGAISLVNNFRENVSHNLEVIDQIERDFKGALQKGGG